ncbi:unnamed protein product [Oikopleura dioica]|uniref:Molybdate-anion transporter n=1 Tax=Oikopleura dioica TaxID=34765 RepID=E4WQ17_OIKDI|nr:unnamed protein product [Oikopleura dioica]
MFISTTLTFLSLLVFSGSLETLVRRKKRAENQNPQFLTFQKTYLATQFVILLADWLQAPYNYKLYSSYRYTEQQIVIIFVLGHAISIILTPFANYAADMYGRRLIVCLALALYSLSSLLKVVNDYSTLLISSIMASCASLLIFSSSQGWYTHEHIESHDFPMEWISDTLEKVSFWSGSLSVLAGVISYLLADLFSFNPVAPFLASIPLMILALCMSWSNWTENKSLNRSVKFSKSCVNGIREIVSNRAVLLCGTLQALFEAVISIFVFLWTPVLDKHGPPLGLVFATFMAANLAGSRVNSLMVLKYKNITIRDTLFVASCIGFVSTVVLEYTSHPEKSFPVTSFFCLTAFQFAVGIYVGAMGPLQNELIKHNVRTAVSSWFRIPLKLIACIGLISLHSDDNFHGTRKLFLGCAILMAMAILISIILKNTKPSAEKEPTAETDRLIESTKI